MKFKEVTKPFSYTSGVYNYGINADGGSYLFQTELDGFRLEFSYRLKGTEHFFCGKAETNEFSMAIDNDGDILADFNLTDPELTLEGAEELANSLIATGNIGTLIKALLAYGAYRTL